MDMNEMRAQGTRDAQADVFNAFYYEHYFPYRQGYDSARRALQRGRVGWRAPLAIAALVAVLIAIGAVWALRRPAPVAPTIALATLAPRPTFAPLATAVVPTVAAATPTTVLVATPGLQIGARVRIANTEGRALRGRAEPALAAPVRVSFAADEVVEIRGGPVAADGYVWWQISGRGGSAWSAERSLEGIVWLLLEP